MATGDVTNLKRPRYEANERLDVVDADAQSRAMIDSLANMARAVMAAPPAAGGAPVGLIMTGFSLTLNPSAAPNIVRINSELGVAFDADGGLVVKPAGTTVDITAPSGVSHLYIYASETPATVAPRFFITPNSPFTEYVRAISTEHHGTLATYARAGSIVASDNIGGVTRALCLIGTVTNTAGTITCTGYHAVTAPNGTAITNRLSTAQAHGLAATSNTVNSAVRTPLEMLQAVAYMVGNNAWLNSSHLTPAAGNNYGAFQLPAGGVDKAYRNNLGYITIGNGTTVKGDFDLSDYANAQAMFVAAFAALPTAGGTVFIKPGVTINNWDTPTGDVAVPAGKHITLEGAGGIDGNHNGIAALDTIPAQISAASATGFYVAGAAHFTLKNLIVDWVDGFLRMGGGGGVNPTTQVAIENVYFRHPGATTIASAAVRTDNVLSAPTDILQLNMRDVAFSVTTNADVTVSGICIDVGMTMKHSHWQNIGLEMRTDHSCTMIYHRSTIGQDCIFEKIDIRTIVDASDNGPATPFYLGGGTTTDARGFIVRDLTIRGSVSETPSFMFWNSGLRIIKVPPGTIFDNVKIYGVGYGIVPQTQAQTDITYRNCSVHGIVIAYLTGVAHTRIRFQDCTFLASFYVDNGTNAITDVSFEGCTFTAAPVSLLTSSGNISGIVFADCRFGRGSAAATSDIFAIAIVTSTTGDLATVSIQRCTFTNMGPSQVPAGAHTKLIRIECALGGAYSGRLYEVVDCTFDTWQSLPQTAAATAWAAYAVYVYRNAGMMRFNRNTFVNCGVKASGNQVGDIRAFCIEDNAGSQGNIEVIGNQYDGNYPTSGAGLLRLLSVSYCNTVRVEGNTWAFQPTTSTYIAATHVVYVWINTSTTCRLVSIAHNLFRTISSTTDVNIASIIRVASGNNGFLSLFSVVNNVFPGNYYNHAGGVYLIHYDSTNSPPFYTKIAGNVNPLNPAAGDRGRITFDHSPSYIDPVLPGVGSAFADNGYIYSGN